MRNFHVPLPDELYEQLQEEAKRSNHPATQVARDAIAAWVREKQRVALHEAIVAYAQAQAGTEADLDPAWEAAGVSSLMEEEPS